MRFTNLPLEISTGLRFHPLMIRYRYVFEDGETVDFEVNPDNTPPGTASDGSAAGWTALEFHQCENCPLSKSECSNCPAALDLQAIAAKFSEKISFHRVTVTVETPERTISKECDVQSGLRSLIGLVLAVSGCPVLGTFRAMARHHLPFASLRETLIRTVGFYHLRQYFVAKRGQDPDWELKGLGEFYSQIQSVNMHLKSRLEAASKNDANLNAIGSLFYTAMTMQCSLEENLEELEPDFLTDQMRVSPQDI